MTTELASPDVWAQFGISGVVIGALFVVIVLGFKRFVLLLENQQETFQKVFKEQQRVYEDSMSKLQQQHQEERKEWSNEAERRDQRYTNAFDMVANAIKETRNNSK